MREAKFQAADTAKRPTDEEFERFAGMLHYRRMDLSQPEHYAGLRRWIDERGADTAVLYLATSPYLFPVICEQLGAAGLNGPKVRVVLVQLLQELAAAKADEDLPLVVVTFWPHPISVLRPALGPMLLTGLDQRIELLGLQHGLLRLWRLAIGRLRRRDA